MWTVYDYVFSAIFWATGSTGIITNICLIYLIFFKCPKNLHVYRIFLANVAFTDLLFTISTTFTQIRIIPSKWAFAYVPLGPAAIFGSEITYVAYGLQLHAIFYTFLSFPLSFGFRYYVLIRPIPNISTCVLICLGLWILALAQHILFIFSEAEPESIRIYLAANKPFYNLTDYVIAGNNMAEDPLTCVTLATIILPMFPIYALVIYFYKRIHRYLHENITNMRERTINGHKRLTQALTIQASLPIFFIFPPITIYGLYHLELINFTVIEYLVYVLFRSVSSS